MSPRAACRLETLGFSDVYDYGGGKAEWLGYGLPREGENASVPYAGELYSLLVGTLAGLLCAVHPFWVVNTAELNESLIGMGQHPIFATDTQAILEKIGFFLDEEHEDLFRDLRSKGMPGHEISRRISDDLDLTRVLTRAAQKWDGGYTLCALIARTRTPPSDMPPRSSGGGVFRVLGLAIAKARDYWAKLVPGPTPTEHRRAGWKSSGGGTSGARRASRR